MRAEPLFYIYDEREPCVQDGVIEPPSFIFFCFFTVFSALHCYAMWQSYLLVNSSLQWFGRVIKLSRRAATTNRPFQLGGRSHSRYTRLSRSIKLSNPLRNPRRVQAVRMSTPKKKRSTRPRIRYVSVCVLYVAIG